MFSFGNGDLRGCGVRLYLSSLGFTGGVGGARGVRVLVHILGSGKASFCCNVASFLFFLAYVGR